MQTIDKIQGWVTGHEASVIMGCTTSLVRQYAKDGRIARKWIDNRSCLYRLADVVKHKKKKKLGRKRKLRR